MEYGIKLGNTTPHIITARNVNGALSDGLWWLHVAGVQENSRNGPVLVAPGPVMTVYRSPEECVLFSHQRNANPFFHFFEALWMLAGRNDVAFVAQFNSGMSQYSDDGVTLHSAYGHRWRLHFGRDQLADIATELIMNPESRRAVLTMWDVQNDLAHPGKDLPCNTQVYFDLRGKRLNMTVVNRSNDAVWGCYGANAVHFSFLQQFLAAWIDVPVGQYCQMSNNLHVYMENPLFALVPNVDVRDLYRQGLVGARPLLDHEHGETMEDWEDDLKCFMSDPGGDKEYACEFFNAVVAPMYIAWKERENALTCWSVLRHIGASDWATACGEWVTRRDAKRTEKKAGQA